MTKNLRNNRNYRALLVLSAIYFIVMSLIDGQKETPYLIHIIPFFCVLFVIFLYHQWEKNIIPKPLIALVFAFLLILQSGGMALRIKQNTYTNFYQPAVNFLKQNAGSDDLIMASSDFGFGLKFPQNLLDDGRFGYYTGKRPKFIVTDDAVKSSWEESKEFFPAFYEYFPRLLNDEYEIAYENDAYKIYVRRHN